VSTRISGSWRSTSGSSPVRRPAHALGERQGPCPCTMRRNPPGSPVACHRGTEASPKGLSRPSQWPAPPSGPPRREPGGRPSPAPASRPWRLPPTTAGSPRRGLRPRRDPQPPPLAQRPDGLRQASGPGRRPGLPARGRVGARRRLSLEPRGADARGREANMIGPVRHGQRLVAAGLPRAQRGAPASPRRPRRPAAPGDAREAGGLALPAVRRQPLRDGLAGAAHDARRAGAQGPALDGLDDLRLAQHG
jgi:hypothetical protein